jgi:iron(III) transport system permease protein
VIRFWYAAVGAFLLLFLVAPVATVVVPGLSGQHLAEAVLHPVYRAGISNALAIAGLTTALCLAIAVPLAWLAVRVRFTGDRWCQALLLGPLILPPFVGALGFFQILGVHGALNGLLAGVGLIPPGPGPDWLGGHRFLAVVVIEALHLYPFLYLTTSAAVARVGPAWIEAARAAGAPPAVIARRIIIPVLAPGLVAGGTVVFVWSFTELGTPLMLGFDRHIAVQIWAGLGELGRNHLPFAQVLIMLVIAAGAYAAVAATSAARLARAGRGRGIPRRRPARLPAACGGGGPLDQRRLVPHGAARLVHRASLDPGPGP